MNSLGESCLEEFDEGREYNLGWLFHKMTLQTNSKSTKKNIRPFNNFAEQQFNKITIWKKITRIRQNWTIWQNKNLKKKTFWKNDNHTNWQLDVTTIRQNDNSTKRQFDKTTIRPNVTSQKRLLAKPEFAKKKLGLIFVMLANRAERRSGSRQMVSRRKGQMEEILNLRLRTRVEFAPWLLISKTLFWFWHSS